MKKRFVIVFIMVLCLLTFVGCLENEAEKVLAMGVRQKPDVVNYEVGMPLDVTGGKVAVVYDNEPTEIVMFDLTEAMINKESYNINVPGTYDVEVIYYFGGEKYSATYEVEYAVKGYKTNAIDVINAYKQDVVYSADGEDVVEAIKSLAVINVKLSNNEKEVKAVVANAKQKIDAVPTKAQEDFNNKPSASLVQAQANAIAEIENYCLKDKNGNVITYPDLYAQIISANRTIGKAEVKAAESVEEVQIAVITAKANIDNAVLGNKTLDEINSSKVAADAAASVAQTQAGIAANKASEAQSAKEAAVAAKDAAESAQAKAEGAQAKAEGAQAKAETAQKAAEAAQKAAEAAKKAVEDIQKDINATKAEINKAKEDAQKAQVAAEKAKAEAEKAQQAAVKAKDEAVVAQQAAETAKTAAEAAKVAAELAQTKAETAQAKAEAAAQAAEEAKKAAADILEEIKGIYNQIPSAAAAIAEVNGYVQDADYAGIYKLLVQNTKTSFVAAIKMAKTDAEVNELVAAAKAQLDQIADKTSIGAAADAEAALELEAAKLSAKAEFKEYVDILDFQKPAGAPFPGEEYPENPDQQQLLDVINALITEIEAEIDAATTISSVNVALAKGMGQAHLETIYVDFYSSYLVQNLGKKFRAEYESIKASYSKENYEQLLQIMDFYVTYIGRIDKLDQLNAKYAQALEELDAIKTQSEEVADMIFAVSLPILIEVSTGDFDSKRDELDAIEAKLVEFGVRAGTNLRCIDELENYPDPQDPNATINMIALFDKYLARYAELETAKANANVAATGVIALIDALTAKELIVLVVDKPFVEAARDAYDLWIDTFFTNAATGSYDAADVMEALNTRLVKNYAKLQEAEARIAQLEAAKAAAPAVDALIEAIIDEANGEYITLADEAEFFAAEQAYCDWMQQYEINEALTPANADFVTLRGVLATYKERLDVLNQAKAAAEATDGAIALIDAIIDEANGEYITLADETEFFAAEQAYCDWMTQYAINEALEPLNADIVSNRADLAAYKARLDVLNQAKGQADAVVNPAIEALTAKELITLADKPAIEAARDLYEDWKQTYAIDPVAEPINDALVTKSDVLVAAEERIEQLEAAKAAAPAVDALIEAIIDEANGEYITLADEAEFFAAEQAYCDWMQQYEINEALTPANADFVTLRGVLATYKERLDVLNQAKAAAEATDGAIALIDAIIDEANGEYITLADETEFFAAEQAYCDWMTQYAINEALEPLNADIVSNRADLAAYKARIDVLNQANAAAPAVDALIDAVVPTGAVTLDDLAALEAAEAAYEAWLTTYAIDETLEPLNADMVEGREDLVAYREKYEALKISVAAVEAAIDAIGSVNINSENSIDNAEKLYQKLVVENNGVDASPYVDYATLLSSRAELEALLYGEYRANAYNEISELINKIVDQMGSSRNITERHNVKAAGNTALTLINDSVAAPVAPSPYEFGAWEAQRTAYEQAFDNIIKDSKNSLYKAAIYLVSGDSTNGYDVNIYAEGTYSKFITKEGESIKAVKDLYIDATVGTGHVELQGLSISGTVYVNGGGSSSVVFKDCVVGSIEVNYEGVRVELNADVHVNEKVVLGNNLDSSKEVILDVKDAELKDVEVYCAAQIKGTKADVTTNVAVKAEVALKIDAAILADAKFEKAEDVEEYQINSTPVDSEVLEVAKDGTVTVSAPAIELDSNKTDGKLAYVIEGTAIEFGGEGQKLVYNNGYRLGVKITAPALVEDYAKAVVTVNGEAYTPVMNGNFFDYVFEVAEAPYEVVIKVLWMEGLNEFTYTVKVLEGTNLDISAGDFTADEAKVAGPNAVVVAEKTTLTVSGELKYYAANEAYEGAEAGYYFGYKLVPDAALEAETEEKVIKVTAEILANGYSFTKVYEAEEKEFTYNVVFNDATLEVPAAKVEKYGEDYAETVVEVAEKVITVKGFVPYILADEALGRAAGYRVGLVVAPVEGVAFGAKLVKVDGVEIEIDSELAVDGKLYYFVPVNPETKEYTFEVKWNAYSEAEVYTLVIDTEAEFEVPAPEEVVVKGEATVKTNVPVTFSAEVFPKYASQEVVWSVTPASVAKIDAETGVLTGLWKGTATVVAKAVADNAVVGEFKVTVEVSEYSVKEIVAMTPKTTNAADKVAVSFDGVIVALQYKGYWVADETGLVLIYTGSTTYPKVGTYVQVTGKVTTYEQGVKFTSQISDSSYVALEGEAPKYDLTPVPYELAESYEKGIDSLAKATESGYYGKVLKVKGTLSVSPTSNNYWWVTDAEGHRFYISSANTTKDLKAGYEAELDLLVREVFYVKDSSNFNNYDACTLGGFYLGTPTVYAKDLTVDSTVEAGSVEVVNGLTYIEGVNLFATVQEAVDAAKDGDEIVVKAGTYAETLIITKEVTLVGPNAGVHGNADNRGEEAVIDSVTEINGANTTVDGLKFTKAIKVGADFVTIKNCYVDPTETVNCNGNNRKGCIVDSVNISDLTVKDNYIDAPGTENSHTLQFMSFTHVTNLAILNNYITNSEQSKVSYDFEGMILYYAYGTLDIIGNVFAWGTDGYIFNLGYYGNYCTDVNIIDNEFTHNGIIKQNATIWIRRNQNAEANINIIGNSFIAFKGTTLLFSNAAKAPVINVKYNYFDAETSYKASSGNGYPTIVTENNYYAAAQTTATSDYGVLTSKEALDEAYAATKEPVEVFAGTISFADKANRVSFSTSKQVWSQNGITVTNNKDKSTSNVADYANPARFYKSSQVVVEHEKKISKIVIKTTGGEKYQILASDVFAGAELSVSGTTATLVLAEASNSYSFNCSERQLRVASIDVYVLE